MKKRIKSDEIDILNIIIIIWNNKLKIAAITLIFMALSAALYFAIKPSIHTKTKILPITIFEDNLYSSYNLIINNYNFNENKNETLYLNQINKKYLLDLFLEKLNTKVIIIEALKNFQLIDRKEFNDEKEYSEVVKKKALNLNLLNPVNVDGNEKGEIRPYWIIEFKTNDLKKWKEALSFIESEINKDIQNYLRQKFDTNLNNLKLLDQFELEDLEFKIKNARDDYYTETNNRLAFLKEQALIARTLNIENRTLEVENFTTPSGVISNLQTPKLYYLRGYSMIEKEIELIENRTNKDAFTKDLLDLEKKKRNLLEDKSLERIKNLFNDTPIFTTNNFKAASIVYQDTKFQSKLSLLKIILFSGIFGIIFGIFYIFVSVAIKQRK